MSGRSVLGKGSRTRAQRPNLEGLEDRFLLYATTGDAWTNPKAITYSFMPDGTNVGGVSSSLFQTMNAVAPTATWEAQIEKAFAVWETIANVQLIPVSDGGEAEDVAGDQQGDPSFGDIRIGAIPEQSGELAFAFFPPPANGGTDSGDIFFNSNVNWQINTGYDIETVALHEIGHALGMDHSLTSQAIMYAYYTGVKQTPNSDDISGIDSIYGAVPSGAPSNGSMSTATNITSQINGNGQIALTGLEINSATAQNYYEVTVPSTTNGTMTVSMQAANFSSLCPRVTIYNSSGSGLAQTSNVNMYGTTATVTITGVTPGQVYYIRGIAANTGAGSVGNYGLLVNFGSLAQSPLPGYITPIASQPDQGGGSSQESVADGSPSANGAVDRRGFIRVGWLHAQGDELRALPRTMIRERREFLATHHHTHPKPPAHPNRLP